MTIIDYSLGASSSQARSAVAAGAHAGQHRSLVKPVVIPAMRHLGSRHKCIQIKIRREATEVVGDSDRNMAERLPREVGESSPNHGHVLGGSDRSMTDWGARRPHGHRRMV